MTPYIEQAIKDAAEKGGYDKSILEMIESAISQHEVDNAVNIALLDHLFWQALGRARGYSDMDDRVEYALPREYDSRREKLIYLEEKVGVVTKVMEISNVAIVMPYNKKGTWEKLWHSFITHLAAGLDAESFFKSL